MNESRKAGKERQRREVKREKKGKKKEGKRNAGQWRGKKDKCEEYGNT